MKKIFLIFGVGGVILLMLTGCKSNKFTILDTTKEIKDFACAEALELFYSDNDYNYYWECIKNDYMYVKYEDGREELISDALNNKKIEIKDLDKFNIKYYKEDNNKDVMLVKNYLFKFNDTIYTKSNSILDYKGCNEFIGTIDKLIDVNNIPKNNGETNNQELLNAKVCEANSNTSIIFYNNEYVLFEKFNY